MMQCPLCKRHDVDERTFRAAKYEAFLSVKTEVLNWLRHYGVFAGLALTIVLATTGYLAMETVLRVYNDSIKNSIDLNMKEEERKLLESTEEIINTSVATANSVIIQTAHELERNKGLEGVNVKHMPFVLPPSETLKKALEGEQSNLDQPLIVYPISYDPRKPREFFRDEKLKFQWVHGDNQVGKFLYTVQFSKDFEFPEEQSIKKETNLHITELNVEKDLFEKCSGPTDCSGNWYWRVKAELPKRGNPTKTGISNEVVFSEVGKFAWYESAWQRILNTGVIRIGIAPLDIGDFLKEKENLDLDGLDFLVAKEIAQKIRVGHDGIKQLDPVFFDYMWEDLWGGLLRKEVDFIISALTKTLDRENIYSIKFSSYCSNPAVAIIPDSFEIQDSNKLDLSDLKTDIIIGVEPGTTGETIAKGILGEDTSRLLRYVQAGKIFKALQKKKSRLF